MGKGFNNIFEGGRMIIACIVSFILGAIAMYVLWIGGATGKGER